MPVYRRPAGSRQTASAKIAAVRRFNRFYTQRIGVLRERWGRSRFSLTQSRVLYEIQSRENPTASEIARALGIDAGYLSRMLNAFERSRLIRRETSAHDARQSFLFLTARGRTAFAPLETRTNEEASAMLSPLGEAGEQRLVDAMQTIESLLTAEPARDPFILRPPRPGDFGWVVARHGAIYGEEFGWDGEIEAVCAEIVAGFIRNYDPNREFCRIAERDGVNIGSAFLVREEDSETVARLRMLLVDPRARGMGVGSRLVKECVAFARSSGYARVVLGTYSVLTAARRTYESAGFSRVTSWTHRGFGQTLQAETWELEL